MTGIDYFNRNHALHGIKTRVALRARKRMYERVLKLSAPSAETRVLDVGVTPDLEIPYNNFFERWYPHTDRLTVCSIEDCRGLETRFPGLTFKLIEGPDLPFRDGEFDLAVSFAVVEHVGTQDDQRHFVGELARVADEFVLYTPYRYFPVEMHTLLPLLHWLPTRIYRTLWRKMGLTFWADERNLNLLSLGAGARLLPSFGSSTIRLLWTCGWPSNIEIHWRRQAGDTQREASVEKGSGR